MNPYQIIRQKCIEADPSIMNLTRGCRIEFKSKAPDNPAIILQMNHAGNYLVEVYGTTTTVKANKIVKIIGREILAHDIQRILPPHWYMKWDSGVKRFEFVNMKNYGNKWFKNEYFSWRNIPLHKQSDEAIQRLSDVIEKHASQSR